MQYLTDASFLPFSIAIMAVALIFVIEMVGVGLGAIDFDFSVDHDADPGVLDWLGIGRVPLLVSIVVALSLFGGLGFAIQNVSSEFFGDHLPVYLAVLVAFGGMLPLLGVSSRVLARVLPQDETTAIHIDELIGMRATIQIGVAEPGKPARAFLTDQHGMTHYVMVEPTIGSIEQGEEVILASRDGALFTGVSPNSVYFKPVN